MDISNIFEITELFWLEDDSRRRDTELWNKSALFVNPCLKHSLFNNILLSPQRAQWRRNLAQNPLISRQWCACCVHVLICSTNVRPWELVWRFWTGTVSLRLLVCVGRHCNWIPFALYQISGVTGSPVSPSGRNKAAQSYEVTNELGWKYPRFGFVVTSWQCVWGYFATGFCECAIQFHVQRSIDANEASTRGVFGVARQGSCVVALFTQCQSCVQSYNLVFEDSQR